MKGLRQLNKPVWILLVVIGLVAGHGLIYYALTHMPLSFAVVSGLIAVIVVRHLGLLGAFFALLWRHPRRKTR